MSSVDPAAVRRIILQQSKRANVGHIGCALSVADIVACLYGRILRIPSWDAPDRDRFVLSKGHAALALYSALALSGHLRQEKLATFCGDGSLLGVHPEHELPGVDFSTGSLGSGVTYAVGAALAARLQRSERRVYTLLSDGECNEGSVWEAVMFAGHHRLANLTAIVDWNGQQAFGYAAEVMDQRNLPERWRAFGWSVQEVDGHDSDALAEALQTPTEQPRAVLARTVFGKGVSFMERELKWHYLPMSDSQYAQALDEIGVAAIAA